MMYLTSTTQIKFLKNHFRENRKKCTILLKERPNIRLLQANLPVVFSPLQQQSGAEQTPSMTGLKGKQRKRMFCLK